jgi:hypothetical protein
MPETALFEKLAPRYFRRTIEADGSLGLKLVEMHVPWPAETRMAETKRYLESLSAQIGAPRKFPAYALNEKAILAFLRHLDRTALRRGDGTWIEKTPNHTFYIDTILRLVPDAKFIHLIRPGEDVVASCIQASLESARQPESWAFQQSLPWHVAYWNTAMRIHLSHIGQDRHFFLLYEDLIAEHKRSLREIRDFAGLSTKRVRRADLAPLAADIASMPWQSSARSGVPRAPERRFESLFGSELQAWIRSNLLAYDPIASACRSLRKTTVSAKRR